MPEYNRIAPSQFIPLTFQLFDGTVAPTRFVKSVIINATTRVTIKTKNLTDNGNGDFSLFSITPASLSIGENNFFEVVTTVYSDSGYITPDLDYAVEKEVYYVKEETSGAILGGGEGSPSESVEKVEKIDYKKIAKIVWEHKKAKLFIEKVIKIFKKTTIVNKNVTKSRKDISGVAEMILKALKITKKNTDKNTKLVIQEINKMTSDLSSLKEKINTINEIKEEIINLFSSAEVKSDLTIKGLGLINSELHEVFDDLLSNYSKKQQELESNLLFKIQKSDVSQQIGLLERDK